MNPPSIPLLSGFPAVQFLLRVGLMAAGILLAATPTRAETGETGGGEPGKLPLDHSPPASSPVPVNITLPRVRVASGGSHFVLSGLEQKFVPWGFNYLGEFGKLAEDDWETPEGWARIGRDFREMRSLGANVVRWHLQFETFMAAPDKPKPPALILLKKLLEVARRNGLYLDLTGLNCFRLKRVPTWYDALPEKERWAAQACFWSAVAETCAGDPAVFCYDLMNEPVIGEPGRNDHPWLGGELGGFHFVQRISNKPAGRETRDIADAWAGSQIAAIRGKDPDTLITVGVIPWALVWPAAKPVFYSPQILRHFDFVSVHFYPATGRLEKELAALAVYDLGKPLVIEETFPMECSVADFAKFVDAAAPRADGWISHFFGHTPAEHRAGAEPAGAITAEFLEYWRDQAPKMTESTPPKHGDPAALPK